MKLGILRILVKNIIGMCEMIIGNKIWFSPKRYMIEELDEIFYYSYTNGRTKTYRRTGPVRITKSIYQWIGQEGREYRKDGPSYIQFSNIENKQFFFTIKAKDVSEEKYWNH